MPHLFKCILKLSNFDILISKLPNYFGHSNSLSNKDPPKLLSSYSNTNYLFQEAFVGKMRVGLHAISPLESPSPPPPTPQKSKKSFLKKSVEKQGDGFTLKDINLYIIHEFAHTIYGGFPQNKRILYLIPNHTYIYVCAFSTKSAHRCCFTMKMKALASHKILRSSLSASFDAFVTEVERTHGWAISTAHVQTPI